MLGWSSWLECMLGVLRLDEFKSIEENNAQCNCTWERLINMKVKKSLTLFLVKRKFYVETLINRAKKWFTLHSWIKGKHLTEWEERRCSKYWISVE